LNLYLVRPLHYVEWLTSMYRHVKLTMGCYREHTLETSKELHRWQTFGHLFWRPACSLQTRVNSKRATATEPLRQTDKERERSRKSCNMPKTNFCRG